METIKETITIPMEEYKELLIIKGKYEELKSIYSPDPKSNIIIRSPWENKEDLTPPYKVTCKK